jgi:hypothetical protein
MYRSSPRFSCYKSCELQTRYETLNPKKLAMKPNAPFSLPLTGADAATIQG